MNLIYLICVFKNRLEIIKAAVTNHQQIESLLVEAQKLALYLYLNVLDNRFECADFI